MQQQITTFPCPGTPVPAPVETSSSRAAAAKRAEAERKREERDRRRVAGLPDPRVIDGAIAAALASVLQAADAATYIRRRRSAEGLTLDVQRVFREAMRTLVRVKGMHKDVAGKALSERLRLGA